LMHRLIETMGHAVALSHPTSLNHGGLRWRF
jgi:hypothetical protein